MGVTIKSDVSDQSDLSDKMGASRYTPWVRIAAVWYGSGEKRPLGYAAHTAPPTTNLIILIILISAARRA